MDTTTYIVIGIAAHLRSSAGPNHSGASSGIRMTYGADAIRGVVPMKDRSSREATRLQQLRCEFELARVLPFSERG